MTKLNCLNLDAFLRTFSSLEETAVKVQSKGSALELMLEDSSRLLKHGETRETALIEERDSLQRTVSQLQQSVEAQCNLRVENERLDDELKKLKKENDKKAEEAEAEIQRHAAETRAAEERHQRALEAVRRQSRTDVAHAQTEAVQQMEAQVLEVKQQLEAMEQEVKEVKQKLREQEREHQSQVLKLQMEFGAKLARVQSSGQSQQQQQQQQHSPYLHQNIFKRKLQFFQEERNKEVAALQQRIRELEEGQLTALKRRKVTFNK